MRSLLLPFLLFSLSCGGGKNVNISNVISEAAIMSHNDGNHVFFGEDIGFRANLCSAAMPGSVETTERTEP